MEYRINRTTGDRISVIGLGTSYICDASEREAVDALVALGYTNLEAVKAVRSVEMTKDMDAEAVLKASLKYLAFL